MMAHFRNTLLATTALIPLEILSAAANPLGSQVVGGTANVHGQGTSSVTVTQSTNNAIINWQSFNIGSGQTTQFAQPNSSSVTLNRVTGNLGASVIDGTLTANGRVFLVNPDGILFGANSKVNVGGFLATTNDIKNQDFMAGRYQFNIPGRPDASIVSLGSITAQSGGFAALVAPGVRNTGTITATLGTVGLAAGNSFSLDFYGDRLITLGINDSIAAKVIDVSTGQPLDALVKNEGTLKANGGRVELTAAAARQVVDSVINNTGVIEANSIGTHNGMIVLGAATSTTKPAGAPAQTVKLSGTLSAAGRRKNKKGGTIVVSGENIQLTGAKIDVSGQAGGGKVLIGGDVGGGNGNPAVATNPIAALETFKIANASTVSVDSSTRIGASANTSGDGGKVIVWADQTTTFYGTILARGGLQSGNGGFVETSGHQTLTFDGLVDTNAPRGKNGTLLLDPVDVTIDTNPGTGVITASAIQSALLSGDVVVSTNVPGADLGNINVAASLTWSTATTLTLNANNNISINAPITGLNGGLILSADASGSIAVPAAVNVGTFVMQNGNWSQVNSNLPAFSAVDFQLSGGTFLRAISGDGSSGAPYKIADVYGLQGVGSIAVVNGSLAFNGSFAIANDIDASATKNWNGGIGFLSIGEFSNVGFVGSLDGGGHVIDQLTSPVGLFGRIGSGGSVSNLSLTNVVTNSAGFSGPFVGGLASLNLGSVFRVSVSGTVIASNGATVAGGLVGANSFGNDGTAGSISESFSSATVSVGNTSFFGSAGGLVGQNQGTITNSYSTGSVTVGSSSPNFANYVGGLVGVNAGIISSSYATGFVSGGANTIIGGLVGWNPFGPAVNSYWDTQSTGQQASSTGTNLTTALFKSGLPSGFDPTVWGSNPSANTGYPYLLWSALTPPPTLAPTPDPTPAPSSTPAQASLPSGAAAFPTGQAVFFTPTNTQVTNSTPQTNPLPNFETINGQNVYVPPYLANPITASSSSAPAAKPISTAASASPVVTSSQVASFIPGSSGSSAGFAWTPTIEAQYAASNTTPYGLGYCTDYAAAIYKQVTGKSLNLTGDAGTWYNKAAATGSGLQTMTPAQIGSVPVGSIVVWAGTTSETSSGHVGVVMSNADGVLVITQANWGPYASNATNYEKNNVITENFNVHTEQSFSYTEALTHAHPDGTANAGYALAGFILP